MLRVAGILLLCCGPAIAQVGSPELIAQAKKEGRVTWYTTVSIPESKQFIDMFEKQYPFIKVDLLRSGSGPLVNRIVSEYAAKNYAADVLHGMLSRGGFTVLKQRNIIGRYESPERKYFPAELKDKDGYWASTFQNTFVLAYNKRNVKPDDVPKTYEDLLKPTWKGRQIINDTDNFEWFDGLLKFWDREKGSPIFAGWRSKTRSFSAARAVVFSWWRRAKRRSPSAMDRTRKASSIKARPSSGFHWSRWWWSSTRSVSRKERPIPPRPGCLSIFYSLNRPS
jgi:ABC-type thiamine transport system substrate-binding protein